MRLKAAQRALACPSVRALNALGAVSACVLALALNVLAARFARSWDVTSAGLYTLAPATEETLAGLVEPVEILVFLSQGDPALSRAERLLAEYAERSARLSVRYVDPDRSPAEFLALTSKYELVQGRTEQGRLVSEAALLVTQGSARWVIAPEEISAYDEEEGTVQPRLEQALTEALRQVQKPAPTEVCFSQGQQELSLDNGGPEGLAALKAALERNNYRVRTVDLLLPRAEPGLRGCDLAIVAGPAQPFAAAAAERLLRAAQAGTQLFIAASPVLDEDGNVEASGLETVLEHLALRFKPALVFEQDPKYSLPLGVGGEAFFATPKPHALTQGLLRGIEPRFLVLLQLAQSIALEGGAEAASGSDGSKSAPLLATSPQAFASANTRALSRAGVRAAELSRDAQGPFSVAVAAEVPRAGGSPALRAVVLGSASPLWSRTWRDPALVGTRRFVESALGWLVTRPALVSLPEKPARQVGLRLTDESLSEVARYVLLYMPGAALLIGLLSLYRRRQRPKAAGGER